MHTKLRIRTLIFYIGLFLGLGFLALVGLYGIITDRDRENSLFLGITLIAMFLVFVGVLIFTLGWIKINEQTKKIKFFYPLKFVNREYDFDEVVGFGYKTKNFRFPFGWFSI